MRVVVLFAVACSSSSVSTTGSGSGSGSAAPPAKPDAHSNYSDDEPDAAPIPEPPEVTGPITIELPVLTSAATEHVPSQIIIQVPGGWHRVESTPVVNDRKLTIDKHTRVTLPEIASVVAPDGTLVLVDRAAKATDLKDLAFALHNECWSLGALRDGKLVGVWPTCPHDPPSGEIRQLALYIDTPTTTIGDFDPDGDTTFVDASTDLADKLRAARTKLGKRIDISYAVSDRTDIEATLHAIADLHDAGLTAARWVPPDWLPMRFPSGVGVDWAATHPVVATVTVGTMAGAPPPVQSRLVAYSGMLRACYQKQLNRNRRLAGTLTATFTLEANGMTSSASMRGTVTDPELIGCLTAQFSRMRFYPPPKTRTRVTVPLTLSH